MCACQIGIERQSQLFGSKQAVESRLVLACDLISGLGCGFIAQNVLGAPYPILHAPFGNRAVDGCVGGLEMGEREGWLVKVSKRHIACDPFQIGEGRSFAQEMVCSQIVGALRPPFAHFPARQNASPARPAEGLAKGLSRCGLFAQNLDRFGPVTPAGQPIVAVIS